MDSNPTPTTIALCGYLKQENPYIWSSDNWLLQEAGKALAERGYSTPIKARKSRGFSVALETSSNLFIVRFDKDLKNNVVERL